MSNNQYGLDNDYFERKIAILHRDGLRNWKPDEFAREMARMSHTADKSVMREPEFAPKVIQIKPEGRRERFQKWVLATKHPVLGFLDGHWLERGDDREGYANEYVQGLWVAFKEFADHSAQSDLLSALLAITNSGPDAIPIKEAFEMAHRAIERASGGRV